MSREGETGRGGGGEGKKRDKGRERQTYGGRGGNEAIMMEKMEG